MDETEVHLFSLWKLRSFHTRQYLLSVSALITVCLFLLRSPSITTPRLASSQLIQSDPDAPGQVLSPTFSWGFSCLTALHAFVSNGLSVWERARARVSVSEAASFMMVCFDPSGTSPSMFYSTGAGALQEIKDLQIKTLKRSAAQFTFGELISKDRPEWK